MDKKNLTLERKDAAKRHIENISKMGLLELRTFDMNLQSNKHDIDEVVWKWVNKAVVLQLSHLINIDKQSGGAMCVTSVIDHHL